MPPSRLSGASPTLVTSSGRSVASGFSHAVIEHSALRGPATGLGYFQRLAAIRAAPRWQAVPMVRRLTGGGAISHHHEVTYALVVPAAHPQARPSPVLYRAVHAAIVEVLTDQGVYADRR